MFADHQLQHQISPRYCSLRMASRGVEGRSPGQSGESGCLSQCQAAAALPKQIPARRLNSIGAIAEIDDVQVRLQNLLFRKAGLESMCQFEFDQLPAETPLAREMRKKSASHHLHGDRAETFPEAQCLEISQGGSTGAPPIHPVMVVEAAVFGCDERGADVPGYSLQGH